MAAMVEMEAMAEMNVPWGNGRFSRVLVYGLGLSGRAAARLLLGRGVEVVGVDARGAAAAGELAAQPGFTAWPGGEPRTREEAAALLATIARGGIDGVVISPGIPPARPLLALARERGVPVIAEVELAFPFLDGPVAAVTGTNGKSTTTALAGALLAAAGFAVEVCGNIGEPLCDRVGGPAGRIFVVELSSFQIEGLLTFRPHAAAFLNLAEDHLDRYASMADYAAAKLRLFSLLAPEAVAVLNADDPLVAAAATAARRRFFSRRGPVEDGCFARASGGTGSGGTASEGTELEVVEVAPGEPERRLFSAAEVPLTGVQNLENAMAAALLARAMGAAPGAVAAGLAGFRGLPHRLERVGARGGVAWFDDSKGTNPAATAKSLEGFRDGSVHLILGGRNKGADLAALLPVVRRKARRLYLIGEAAPELARALAGAASCELAGTLEQAVRGAAARAAAGEVVVLSPACASFDQFRNFAHRGEVFQGLVRDVVLGGADGEEARL